MFSERDVLQSPGDAAAGHSEAHCPPWTCGLTRTASPPGKPDQSPKKTETKYKLLITAAKLNVKHKNTGGLQGPHGSLSTGTGGRGAEVESPTRGDTEMTGLCGGHRFTEKGARGSVAATWCSPFPSPPLLSKAPGPTDTRTAGHTRLQAGQPWARAGFSNQPATAPEPVRYVVEERGEGQVWDTDIEISH